LKHPSDKREEVGTRNGRFAWYD